MSTKFVTAAIIIKEKSVLVMRRAPDEHLAGKWEFPGGKLQENETIEECLQREISEELHITGVTGEHFCDSIYEYSSGRILLKAYFFDWSSGDIALTVHDKMKWLTAKELEGIDLAPADIAIAQRLKEYLNDI